MPGFGDNNNLVLDCPAKQDLGVRAAVFPCNCCYPRIMEPSARGKRGICIELDPLFSAELEQVLLMEKGA
jgi:hypothetical protein